MGSAAGTQLQKGVGMVVKEEGAVGREEAAGKVAVMGSVVEEEVRREATVGKVVVMVGLEV